MSNHVRHQLSCVLPGINQFPSTKLQIDKIGNGRSHIQTLFFHDRVSMWGYLRYCFNVAMWSRLSYIRICLHTATSTIPRYGIHSIPRALLIRLRVHQYNVHPTAIQLFPLSTTLSLEQCTSSCHAFPPRRAVGLIYVCTQSTIIRWENICTCYRCLSFRLATPPGFRVTRIPKGNLVHI